MITERIHQHAVASGERTALVWNGLPFSYRHLAHAVVRMRMLVRPLELPAGSLVVVIAHSLLDCWCTVLALQSLGLRSICARSLGDAQRLGLDNIGALAICTRKLPAALKELDDHVPGWAKTARLTVPGDLHTPRQAGDLDELRSCRSGGGHILYTSGTTGSPKKVYESTELSAARCARRASGEGTRAEDVMNVLDFGLWTALGYRRPQLMWHVGGCVVIDQRSDWAQHLGEHGVTQVALVPSRLAQAVAAVPPDHARQRGWDFSISVGGGALSADLARQALERLARRLVISYASTEMGQAMLRSVAEDPADTAWLQPMPGRHVEIVNEEDRPCRVGQTGALRVRLDALDSAAYLDDPQASARVFRDGWFYPGDLAMRRADGRLRILGRASDVINIGGVKLASAPLEDSLRNALGASAVCAYTGLDPRNPDTVVFAIETPAPFDAGRLRAATSVLPAIASMRFVQLRALPRTLTGTLKIDRIALRQRIAAHLQSNPESP